ncbi:hypothetical protein [Actinoplanes sp. G11-F43]|uniref:hypothetical protein n=1 Tax=Actinoplanes sp. G11-F43 TaxID=3424130 RepID=UPI003D32E078
MGIAGQCRPAPARRPTSIHAPSSSAAASSVFTTSPIRYGVSPAPIAVVRSVPVTRASRDGDLRGEADGAGCSDGQEHVPDGGSPPHVGETPVPDRTVIFSRRSR